MKFKPKVKACGNIIPTKKIKVLKIPKIMKYKALIKLNLTNLWLILTKLY